LSDLKQKRGRRNPALFPSSKLVPIKAQMAVETEEVWEKGGKVVLPPTFPTYRMSRKWYSP